MALGDSRCGRWLHLIDSAIDRDLTIRFGRRAVPGNMPCLPTFVADLTCGVKGATIGSCAVPGNMALQSLDLKFTIIFRN